MRNVLAGFILGVLFALTSLGAVVTFTQVQGRGTPSSGYIILPACPADPSGIEFGGLCRELGTGNLRANGAWKTIP